MKAREYARKLRQCRRMAQGERVGDIQRRPIPCLLRAYLGVTSDMLLGHDDVCHVRDFSRLIALYSVVGYGHRGPE